MFVEINPATMDQGTMQSLPPEAMGGCTSGHMTHMPSEAMGGMDASMMQMMPPEAMASMNPQMIETLPPESQEAFNSLSALNSSLDPSAEGQETVIDGASEALDVAMSESQVQGGANVTHDDSTTHGAEHVETVDDDAVESLDDASSSDDSVV